MAHGWRSQDNLWGLLLSWCASDLVMWIPGVELRSSGIAASRFTCRAISWALDGLLVSYIMVNTRLDQLFGSVMLQHLWSVWKTWNERNLSSSASIGQPMTALGIEAGPAATCKIDKNSEIGQGANRGTGPGRMACGILAEVTESAVGWMAATIFRWCTWEPESKL